MVKKFTHLELENEMHCIAGYYCLQKEVRFKYDGREVLYIVGQANVENSCCANGCWSYALVPGYIVKWQNEKNASGLPVSEVESITDKETRAKIRRMIKDKEAVSQVDFW